MSDEKRRVRLRLFGEDHDVEVPERRGPMRITELFDVARIVTEHVVDVARRRVETDGKAISCKAGCGACCRQLVPISTIEAKRIATLVSKMPAARRDEVRARFVAAVATLENAGLAQKGSRGRSALRANDEPDDNGWENVSRRYWEAEIDCPFLEAGSCSIYEDRPLVCREFMVTSNPSACAARSEAIVAVPRPVRMGEALAAAARAVCGVQAEQLPLTLALEWSSVHGDPLTRSPDGRKLVDALVAAIVVEDE